MPSDHSPSRPPLLAKRLRVALGIAAGVALTGCCAVDGTCGFTPNGPIPATAYERMVATCLHRGGVDDFHKVIDNPGAMAIAGEYDFTCNDGTSGVERWDTQGPKR